MKKEVRLGDHPNQFVQILLKVTARRSYKNEFIKFIIYAIASTDETIDHLETLFETESLQDEVLFKSLLGKSNLLGKKLIKFLDSVEKQHLSKK